MTASQVIQEIEAAGGVLALRGDKITFDVPKAARSLVEGLRDHKAEVIRLLQQRRCPIHGDKATWWDRPDGGHVCALCHPDPYSQAIQQAQEAAPPAMPQGVCLLEWEPKQPPIAITAWSVVNSVPLFIRTTLRQLEAALQDKNWLASNRSVRTLCEQLEQVGVKVEVTASGKTAA